MKAKRLGETLSNLEKVQMKEIDRLQNQINLYEFDKTKDRNKIRVLREKLARRNKTIYSVIRELELMRKEENYKRLLIMINVLKSISKEEEDE